MSYWRATRHLPGRPSRRDRATRSTDRNGRPQQARGHGRRATRAIYARNEDFINPTYYRANTRADIDRMLSAAGLRHERFELIGDPTYLAFNELLFRAALVAESLIDRFAPTTRVHLVGLYQKI